MSVAVLELPALPIELRGVLNPEYWDGLVLGKDPVLCPPNPEADETSAMFAIKSIEAALGSGYRNPVQTYLPGRSPKNFPIGWHTLGTVVAFHQETLFAEESNCAYIDMEDFRGKALAPHPDAELVMEDKSKLSFAVRCLQGAGVVYQESVRYGVVTEDENGKKILVTINSSGVYRSDFGTYTVADSGEIHVHPKVEIDTKIVVPKVELKPIVIGKVQHFKKPRRNNPRLTRVNLLEVAARGQNPQ